MRAKVWLAGWFLGMVASLLVSSQCFAAGFALWEGSARANALGDAVVGRADDPSAIMYDPAGITQLPGLQVESGATGIRTAGTISVPANATLQGTGGVLPLSNAAESQNVINEWALVPNMYATYQASDRIWLGLGIFSPFGLSVAFPSNWFGAYNSFYSEVQSVDVNPNIAFKINDQLSVAAGLDAMEFGLDLQNRLPEVVGGALLPIGLSPISQIKGDTWGYGYNLAVHYKPCKWMAMGISYRSQITEGGDMNDYIHLASGAQAAYTVAHSSTTLPDSLDMGVVFYPADAWSWEIGGMWTRWSNFQSMQFALNAPIYGPANNPLTVQKNWNDTWRLQTGVEYHLTPHVDLRAGYIYDEEAIPNDFADYVLPSNNRNYFSFGTGIHYGNVALDLSYTYIMIESRDVTNSGSLGYLNPTHQGGENASMIAGDITYRFW